MRCCFANCVLSGHDGGNGGQARIPRDTAIFSMGDTWPTALFYALGNYHFLLNICAKLKIELCSFGFEEMAGSLSAPNSTAHGSLASRASKHSNEMLSYCFCIALYLLK